MSVSTFLTIQELAERLRTTAHAVHMQRSRGKFPGVLGVKVGKKVLFSAATVEAWFAAAEAAALAEAEQRP